MGLLSGSVAAGFAAAFGGTAAAGSPAASKSAAARSDWLTVFMPQLQSQSNRKIRPVIVQALYRREKASRGRGLARATYFQGRSLKSPPRQRQPANRAPIPPRIVQSTLSGSSPDQ